MVFELGNAIKKINEYNYKESEEKSLNIAYGIDKNFLFGAAVSITSIILNNKDINLNFHIFTDYESDEFSIKCNELAEENKISISVYYISSDFFSMLPISNAWSIATYYRFIAFEYLSEKIDSVLYLDADVMCKGSLLELLNYNFFERYAAVIPDVAEIREKTGERLKNSELNHSYFNAGVMLVKLNKWKENGFFEKALSLLLDKNNKFQFFDQDVLNLLYVGNVQFLSNNFNCIYGIKQELKNRDITRYKETITESTKLIHYIGVTKPWNTWADYPSAQYFVRPWKLSPWADQPLVGARTPKQFKKKSRHERLQGKYATSIISYIQYLLAKLKSK
ncbi:lipopolysaccharide 1,2-glucosyltransferase [[Pantoea] beijingensis]|uniref:Lipopolysaccharide 1,2-glucosyltransferase n=1 Tax=[Pantoea] beijingensis TaxID=1324864 RepID=A0A443IGJ8_9GAMM|nr:MULTISPECIES: glycosyltransferase [Erwiniaceae]RWR03193.1 lipopolysaccharide 1,2-glucosyltransferase [[Pantoea] beijingensis]